MSKSKRDKQKSNDLPPIISKYQNENMIEDLTDRVKMENNEVDRLKGQLYSLNSDQRIKGIEYIKETSAIDKALGEKTKQNVNLAAEITQIRQERFDFENDAKGNFDRKIDRLKEEHRYVVDKLNDEMSQLRMSLEDKRLTILELKERVESLTEELDKVNHNHMITINIYENKVKEINTIHHNKMKATIEIFEQFLEDNPELITTNLFSVYQKLKSKFDSKIQECIDYREINDKLKDENKIFKIDLINNEDIINRFAIKQVKNKKKSKELIEEMSRKNSQIDLMKGEYMKRYDDLNDKFNNYLLHNDNEMLSLKKTITIKNKEIDELKKLSESILTQRSEVELFFIDALKETKREIIDKKRKEKEKKLGKYFNFLNRKSADDGLYMTSVKPIGINDLEPENKEKILRFMFNKLHESKIMKNFASLRRMIN